MKITVNSTNLSKALTKVNRIVPSRTTLPILSNILLSTESQRLRIAATNLELGITEFIPVNVEDPGSITLPAKTLVDLVNTLPADTDLFIKVAARSQTAEIKCGRIKSNIKGMNAQEFPAIPSSVNLAKTLIVPAEDFKTAIKMTVFATSDDQVQVVLTGVNMIVEGRKIEMQASDGFCASIATLNLPSECSKDIYALVPAKALNEVSKIIQATGAANVLIELIDNEKQMLFEMESVSIVTQLIEGFFPKIQSIVPQKHTTRALVTREDLINAVKSVAIIARHDSDSLNLDFRLGKDNAPGSLVIKSVAAETGDSTATVDTVVEKNPITISVNAKYLLNMLTQTSDSNVVAIEMTKSTSPIIIRFTENENYLGLIMPMHQKE